jgi:transposase-like protein
VSSLTPRPPLAPEDVSRPGGRRHWTAEDRRDMVARYEKGAGTPQIAAAYSVTAETVMKVLRAEGVTIRPRAGSAVA